MEAPAVPVVVLAEVVEAPADMEVPEAGILPWVAVTILPWAAVSDTDRPGATAEAAADA